MIESFKDADALLLWNTGKSRRIPASIRTTTLKKLLILNRVTPLAELKAPPGNCLEALKGDRLGQHSIHINDQFRICFKWREGHAHEVEVVDYH